jgi:Ser-tRNA(Ala) deacylase AlaX
MQTKLIYMEHMSQQKCDAYIFEIQEKNGLFSVILNQTVFYPQGGGQPYDIGIISNGNNVFKVSEVRYIDGLVHHIGFFESGILKIGESISCVIDMERRTINTRLHSAGHLIDLAIKELELNWKPGKGYHFPDGPYIEYNGSLEEKNISDLIKEIENKSNDIISRKIDTRIEFSEDSAQDGKPLRTVYYGHFGIPCGGTHVKNLGDITSITIRKIKQDKDIIKISYA